MRNPQDIPFGDGTFADALRLHKAWWADEEGGVRLIVPAGFDLNRANLNHANLVGANLDRANLVGASLVGANLNSANLIGANLSNANFIRANLDGANLNGIRSAAACIGNGKQIKSAQIERYSITYDAKFLQIGCQRHKIEDWRGFDLQCIGGMDGQAAVDWWAKWRDVIFQIIEMSPATPGRTEKTEAENER